MHADEVRINGISGRVIGCTFQVLNTLGSGFLEKVYENALVHQLRKSGLAVEQLYAATVEYDGIVVGAYTVDLLVEETVVVN